MAGLIFISHRRDDELDFARLLYDSLLRSFPPEHLFMDVEGGIRGGQDFVRVLHEKVMQCDVLLALLGRRWLHAVDEGGRRRLDNPNDFVRIEIESAIQLDKRVIPILVNYAAMPREDELPATMQAFARRQALALRLRSVDSDLQAIVSEIENAFAEADARRQAESGANASALAEMERRLREQQATHEAEIQVLRETIARQHASPNVLPDERRKIEEKARWEIIGNRRDIRELRDHLARFPGGDTERDAQAALEDLLWLELGNAPDIGRLGAFLTEFPRGRYAENARARVIELEQEARERPRSKGPHRGQSTSAAEQLAANLNFGAFASAEDLKRRIWFTLAALVVYRLGTYIPISGIDHVAFAELFRAQSSGILSVFNILAGGAVERMAVFALSIVPYVTASIIIGAMTGVLPALARLTKGGEQGRKQINQYARYLTLVLSGIAACGIAYVLEWSHATSTAAVINPGAISPTLIVVQLVSGTMFLMWLGEQITARGIGNGGLLIVFAGFSSELPPVMVDSFKSVGLEAILNWRLLGLLMAALLALAIFVFIDKAERRLLIQYPRRQIGNRMFQGDNSHLALKLSTSGVAATIFAPLLLLLLIWLVDVFSGAAPMWLADIAVTVQRGQWLFLVVYAGTVVFLTFLFSAVLLNPQEIADRLRINGGFLPGIRPGSRTAEYIDYVLTRITLVGAIFLAVACVLLELFLCYLSVPFYFGGAWFFIVTQLVLETTKQIQGHLLAHQYEGLIRKAKLRGATRR